MSAFGERLLTPRAMAAQLTQTLNDADAGEHEVPYQVVVAPGYCGEYNIHDDTCTASFYCPDTDRTVTIIYPAQDLSLSLDAFTAKHLLTVAAELAAA